MSRKSLFLSLVALPLLLIGSAKADQPSTNQDHFPGMPNIPLPTMGGMQVWEDLEVFAGWRLQHNLLTDHYRLLDYTDTRQAWGTRADCENAFAKAKDHHALKVNSKHAVVMLHGLCRTKTIFDDMAEALKNSGYEPVQINYPSLRRDIDAHAAHIEQVLGGLEDIERVSFVTHSLGGIILRTMLNRPADWREKFSLGRTVMLGPPNQGSVLARKISSVPANLIFGEALEDLKLIDQQKRPALSSEFAIVSGGNGKDGYNPLIPGDDDGVVATSETQLEGASATYLVPQLHTLLAGDSVVISWTINFLKTGKSLAPEATSHK